VSTKGNNGPISIRNNPLKRAVKRSFSRAAHTYDGSSAVQAASASLLADLVTKWFRKPVRRLLDVGCGTGYAARAVQERVCVDCVIAVDVAEPMLHHARLSGLEGLSVVADAELLPVADKSIDGAIVNFVIQWLENPRPALKEIARVLAPGGFLGLAIMGVGSLEQLTRAVQKTFKSVWAAQYYEQDEFAQMLSEAGFTVKDVAREEFGIDYDSLEEMLRRLKAIGAIVPAGDTGSGLSGRENLRRLGAALGDIRPIRTSYVVHYFLAQLPKDL